MVVPERRAAKAGSQPKVASGVAPGRVTARGVTARARLPKVASGAEEMQPEGSADADSTPVSIDSLRRLLDGLRQLS
jgi:hypothetical protein